VHLEERGKSATDLAFGTDDALESSAYLQQVSHKNAKPGTRPGFASLHGADQRSLLLSDP
jgi:hypothetical protein